MRVDLRSTTHKHDTCTIIGLHRECIINYIFFNLFIFKNYFVVFLALILS